MSGYMSHISQGRKFERKLPRYPVAPHRSSANPRIQFLAQRLSPEQVHTLEPLNRLTAGARYTPIYLTDVVTARYEQICLAEENRIRTAIGLEPITRETAAAAAAAVTPEQLERARAFLIEEAAANQALDTLERLA